VDVGSLGLGRLIWIDRSGLKLGLVRWSEISTRYGLSAPTIKRIDKVCRAECRLMSRYVAADLIMAMKERVI